MPIPVAKTMESMTKVSTTITAALGISENFISTPSDGTLPVYIVEIDRCKHSGTSVYGQCMCLGGLESRPSFYVQKKGTRYSLIFFMCFSLRRMAWLQANTVEPLYSTVWSMHVS